MSVTSESSSTPARSAAARSRETTRARLIESGVRLFAERGLHRVTTHDIAHGAGVAAGTFYLHFPDKTALFREIAGAAVKDLVARFEATQADDSDLRSGVRVRARVLVEFAEEQRELVHILFSPESGAQVVEAEMLDWLARDTEAGRIDAIERGEMPPSIHPAVLAQALVGMLARVVAWWCDNPTRATREEVIETLTQIQLTGTHPAPNPT